MSIDVKLTAEAIKKLREDYYVVSEKRYISRTLTLPQMYRKYGDMYSVEQINEALGVYDLASEPSNYAHYDVASANFRREWNEVCRRLNPKAEAWRNK